MRRTREDPLTAPEVLSRIRGELDLAHPSESRFERRLARIRAMQREFREQPVGGRLLALKRMAYWFTASAFDRQAKVVEALLELVEDLAEENRRLELEFKRTLKGSRFQETGRASGDK